MIKRRRRKKSLFEEIIQIKVDDQPTYPIFKKNVGRTLQLFLIPAPFKDIGR